MADGNACLDACTEAVVKGEILSGLIHLAGCGAFLVVGDGACMDISVYGAGKAACPGKGDGEIVSVGLASPAEVRTMPLETLEDVYKRQDFIREAAPAALETGRHVLEEDALTVMVNEAVLPVLPCRNRPRFPSARRNLPL